MSISDDARFRCLVCGGNDATVKFEACKDYYLQKPFTATYVVCQRCGLLQQFPLPKDIGALYDEYPIHTRKSAAYRWLRKLVMGDVYYDSSKLERGQVLLDYGCGDGSFLEDLVGPGVVRLGYEPNASHAEKLSAALSVPVYSEVEQLLLEHRGAIDVITMHFVVEHLTDLDGTLKMVRQLLRPGGELYFVVPHASSMEARLFGRRWHSLDPPRHISFPERNSVRELAARHGLELVQDEAVPFPNGIAGSIPVVLSGRFRFPLFAAAMPLGIALSRLMPDGAHAYHLKPVSTR